MVANLLFVLSIDCSGASSRNRTGTPAINEAADFKSAVSTYSTIEALISTAISSNNMLRHCETKKP